MPSPTRPGRERLPDGNREPCGGRRITAVIRAGQEDCHAHVIHNFMDALKAIPEWKDN